MLHQNIDQNQPNIEFADLMLARPELNDAELFLRIIRDHPDGLSGTDAYCGAASLLREHQSLFQGPRLEEIAAYCVKLIPKLISDKGLPLQIRSLSHLAAEVVSIQRKRSETLEINRL